MAETLGHLGDATWERLAAHELTGPSREAAMDHIGGCAECATIWRGLRELESEARVFDPGVPAAASNPIKQGHGWFGWGFRLQAAAALVVALTGVIGYQFLGTPTAGPPAAAHNAAATPEADAWLAAFPLTKADIHVSSEDALILRGEVSRTEPSIDELAAALEPYRRNDFADAAGRLAGLRSTFPASPRVGLYLGVSYLFLDRASDAVAPLETAAASTRAEVADDGRWYLAVASARNGRIDRARELVGAVCEAAGPQSERACTAGDALRDAQR